MSARSELDGEHEIDRPSKADYLDALRISQQGSASEVLALLESPDELIRREAIKQIRKRRLEEAAPVMELLVEQDDELRLGAILALEELALPRSRATFLRALDDEELRPAGLRGLLNIGDSGTAQAAEKLYGEGDNTTRQIALYVLTRLGTGADESFERLLRAESSWRWRRRIQKAIREARRISASDEAGLRRSAG